MKTRWSFLVFLILSTSAAAAFAHEPGGSLRPVGAVKTGHLPEQDRRLAQTRTKPAAKGAAQSIEKKTLQLLEELREICPTCVVVQTAVPRACPPGCPACPAGSGWDTRQKKCRKFRE